MSTKQRYSELVWRGVETQAREVERGLFSFVSVGEVARAAGVSRPTAAKYLDAFADAGFMARMQIGDMSFYRPLSQNED